MRVLLVDDDPDTCEALVEALEGEDIDVRSCRAPEDALELLRGSRFDVLMTDEVMPGLSGSELVRRARLLDVNLRCLVLSGREAPRDAEVPWMRKPVSLSALLAALATPPTAT
jgi:DNA-binding response OmpR family regulator